ncbi:MAG: hypothetical protein H7Y16_09310 [Candidatus Parcubacteria bacterium]|nr:hypothetical protein [Burkholderiales bacterium]
MRIVLCTSGGYPAAAVLSRLVASPRVELAAILLSTRVMHPGYGFLRGAWELWRRSGLAYACYLGKAVAPRMRARGVALLRSKDINREHAWMARQAPDLIVSAFFNHLIGEPVTGAARYGAVNIHPSMLPQLKGVDPVFYGRLLDSPCLGASVHRVTPEIDGGGVLAQKRIAALPGESVLSTTTRLYGEGAGLLLESLDSIASGYEGAPQPGAGSYFSWPARAQVAQLRRKGIRLV